MKAGKNKEPKLEPVRWVPYAVVAGMWLKRMRRKVGLSIAETAEKAHIPLKKYDAYETGETEMMSGEVLRIMVAIGDEYSSFHILVNHTMSALKFEGVETIPAKAPLPPNNPILSSEVVALTAKADLLLSVALTKAAHK